MAVAGIICGVEHAAAGKKKKLNPGKLAEMKQMDFSWNLLFLEKRLNFFAYSGVEMATFRRMF